MYLTPITYFYILIVGIFVDIDVYRSKTDMGQSSSIIIVENSSKFLSSLEQKKKKND